jgi:hypothetical protein
MFAPVRSFLLLENARRTIAAYTPDQRARVAQLTASGDARLAAGRRTPMPIASCLLLREAVAMFARARAAARDARLDDAALAALDCASEVTPLSPDPLDGREGDAQRVREALVVSDPLFFDRLEPAALARLRIALERAARALRGGVEARSLLHVKALRWGRIAALVVVAMYGLWLLVRTRLPRNVAVGKPVKLSSQHPHAVSPPDGHDLATGRTGYTYAAATNVEDSPNIVIDLQGEYVIDRVEVYNRADGWWDECLPLVVELSRDGTGYSELGRRETHFDFNDPWVAAGGGKVARFVRARVARRGYLALGRLAVFGKKL